jgi:hypothetical protein
MLVKMLVKHWPGAQREGGDAAFTADAAASAAAAAPRVRSGPDTGGPASFIPLASAADVSAPEVRLVAAARLSQTPAPLTVNWYKYRAADLNVKPATAETRLAFVEKLDAVAGAGFAEGVVPLPVDGRWLLQLYLGGPAYDRAAPDAQARRPSEPPPLLSSSDDGPQTCFFDFGF